MSAWAVLVAAGRGTRAGLDTNKVFYPLEGRSPLSRSLDAIAQTGLYEGIVLVLSKDDFLAYRALTAREGACSLVKSVVAGGKTRQESAFAGLKVVPESVEWVSIHDAARPFAGEALFRATLDAARETGSGVISTDVTDTVKRVEEGRAVETLARERLRAVQTPQSFRRAEILRAHMAALADGFAGTDDASLYEREFGSATLVTADGARENVKLTHRGDFLRGDIRMGTGYDVHRLVEGRPLVLCGVTIPWEKGLLGHSDADVALHALMDAMLGALGEGDIGRHFPDSGEQYRGIASTELLRRVVELAREKGYRLGNCDVTVVAQAPKLAPYIEEMRANVARVLGVDISRVNIKATTTERLGFEGEGLGISAQAVAVMRSEAG
ncbi:MAG TPA: 2-C-methyl-D-erythritol 2,4-cyclodiphosphate synthase [Candidatus Alectryocaccomicrobium excrementavium]|uniref:Bifunctional enzyme IspD/IspF n=1 Tax=Candidatus Alectryocaccomicrobium excrementavium TaxID=2840668 RepID=A0A9D1K5F1_9FIRM|nr:2-C-methyl-D-erythritol 2,4-cyclodiphosphate synthase [Candidatus Alectryocaccomicrobium excrementavium]